MRKIQAIFLSLCLLIYGLNTVHAQSAARLDLYNFQTAAFPVVTAMLDVFDVAGNFVTGLVPAAITLLEDNQPRPITSLEEQKPGVVFALALDPGPFFAYRDAYAVNRLDKVEKVIKDWLALHPDSLNDDLNLLVTGGTSAIHLLTTSAFSDALTAYQPNLQNLTTSPETLARALDVVSEPTSQTGSKTVVLYITTIPLADDLLVLQNLTQRAAAQNIRVFVWIVAAQDSFSTPGATALKDLAIQTNGQYILFSGEEPLPSLEMYLAPLRHAYRLEYSSAILTSGGHTLIAEADLNGETVASAVLSFELDVQPPNPILVDPPVQIIRSAPDERTTALQSFLPIQQTISIIIEFPDGRPRPLSRTVLYVDGVQVDENTAEPFDQFTWDLSGYVASGEHALTVEAVDDLGLSKVSLGLPVLVTVVQPPRGLLPWLSRNSQQVALGAILCAGGGLVAILYRSRVKKRRLEKNSRRSHRDPLSQLVQEGGSKRTLRLPWTPPAKPSEAYLVRLKDDGQPITAPPIPIPFQEITFGSDPIQATRILDDPSVSPLHARLVVVPPSAYPPGSRPSSRISPVTGRGREEHGGYILSDENSIAGTWINYEQLTTPRRLQHGDVLHFGRLAYRFMLLNPPEKPAPQVIPTKK